MTLAAFGLSSTGNQEPGAHSWVRVQHFSKELRTDPVIVAQFSSLGFRLAAGGYSQQANRLFLLEDGHIDRSWQISSGLDFVFDERFELSVDAWGKTFDQYRVLDPSGANLLSDGWAAGAELYFRFRMVDQLYGWIALSSANVRLNDDVFITDQPFTSNIVLSWELGQDWTLGFRHRYSIGAPIYEPVSSVFDANNGEYLPQWSEAPNGRLPPYQKSDLRLAKDWMIGSVIATTYLECWVVPPSSNVLYPITASTICNKSWWLDRHCCDGWSQTKRRLRATGFIARLSRSITMLLIVPWSRSRTVSLSSIRVSEASGPSPAVSIRTKRDLLRGAYW